MSPWKKTNKQKSASLSVILEILSNTLYTHSTRIAWSMIQGLPCYWTYGFICNSLEIIFSFSAKICLHSNLLGESSTLNYHISPFSHHFIIHYPLLAFFCAPTQALDYVVSQRILSTVYWRPALRVSLQSATMQGKWVWSGGSMRVPCIHAQHTCRCLHVNVCSAFHGGALFFS